MTEAISQLSIKNQARILAKEAVGDLAIINKVRGHLVVIMRNELRGIMSPKDWAEEVGRKIRIAIPGWGAIKAVNGLMIFDLKYKKGDRP